MYYTDIQNSPIPNLSDISGKLAYKGEIISSIASSGGATGSSNLPANSNGYLKNDGIGNLSWENVSFSSGTVLSYISLSGSGNQYIPSGYLNPIYFNGIVRRSNLIYNTGEPSKIYFSGQSGYYNLYADITLQNNSVFDTYSWVKNGNKPLTNNSSNIANCYINNNDYVEFRINSYTGAFISGNIGCDIFKVNCDANNQTQSTSTIKNGLVSWIHANTSGSIIDEISQLTPSWSGTPLYSSGLNGYAMQFTGTNFVQAIGPEDPRTYCDGFTILSWIRPSLQVPAGVYIMKAEKTHYLYYYPYAGYKVAFDSRAYELGSSTYLNTLSEVIPLNTWKMLCASYSPEGEATFWNPTGAWDIDRNTTTDNRAFVTSNAPFDPIIIGAGTAGVNKFTGLINVCATWNRVLTPKEKSWLYNNGSGRSYNEL